MCGITAISRVAERSSINDPGYFMLLAALAIEPRGQDATGWAWAQRTAPPGESSRFWYHKTPQRARDAVRDAAIGKIDDIAMAIGHTRMATQGDKKDNVNNHPVIADGVMLVHNGIITNDWRLYREYFGTDYTPVAEVDTQVAATLLAARKELNLSTLDVLGLIEGSAAFAWIETTDPTALHLARLQERPMTLARTRRGDLVMSSTPETLADAGRFANLKLRHVTEVPEGTYMVVRDGVIESCETFTPAKRSYGSYSSYGGKAASTTTPRAALGSASSTYKTPTADELVNADDETFDRLIARVRADADRREREIAAIYGDDEFDDEWEYGRDQMITEIEGTTELIEPDGTVLELRPVDRYHPSNFYPALNWMKQDAFFRNFRFPEDFDPVTDDRLNDEVFWSGLKRYYDYRIGLAIDTNGTMPSDEELFEQFCWDFDDTVSPLWRRQRDTETETADTEADREHQEV